MYTLTYRRLLVQPLFRWKSGKCSFHILIVRLYSWLSSTQCARVIFSFWPARLAPQYVSTLPHWRHVILQNKSYWSYTLFWFSPQLLYETFLIVRNIQRDTIIHKNMSSCTVPVIHVRFQWNLYLRIIFSKNTQVSNFKKTFPLGAQLFRADGQTDMTKLTVAFRYFSKAPKYTGDYFARQSVRKEQVANVRTTAWFWRSAKCPQVTKARQLYLL
jgi:hypothetical protein